jgi:RNA polymerase sigma-70 factor (ECF subfamily)
MNLHDSQSLIPLIKGCIKGNRRSQNKLYEACFPYSMSLAMRYGNNQEESFEIVNEAFVKVFSYLEHFDPTNSFAYWLRKIVINTAIDHYHLRKKLLEQTEFIDDTFNIEPEVDSQLDDIDAEELLKLIQNLPTAYRMVFSLYVIEGFTHKEIAAQLGINEGTSKSNYHKAKLQLKKELAKKDWIPKKYAGK